MTPADALSLQLASHEDFVRRTLRGLLRDENEVHDVVQETWLRALGRRGENGVTRSWLARTARSIAISRWRSVQRRRKREALRQGEGNQAGVAEAADVSLQRVEDRTRVAQAVVALQSPYREVVLMRYERGLSIAAIAAERGAPEATVRTQLSRAHALLRERLDADFGDRQRWAGLALPAAAVAGRAGPAGVLAFAGAWRTAAAVAVLAVLGLVGYTLKGGGPGGLDGSVITPAGVGDSVIETAAAGADGMGAPRDTLAAVTATRAIDVRLTDASFDEPLAGRVFGADGVLVGLTGSDGRAHLELASGETRELEFRASGYESRTVALPANLDEEWSVSLAPTAVTTIEAVTTDGAPVRGVHVRVSARARHVIDGSMWSHPPPLGVTWVEGSTDALGRFSFAQACSGIADLRSQSGVVTRIMIEPGEAARVTIASGAATLRFVDAETGEALSGFIVEVKDALDARQRARRRTTDREGEIAVAPGSRELVVVLRDPTFLAATCAMERRATVIGTGCELRFSRLRAGDTVEIRVARKGFEIQLIDASTELAVEGRVTMHFEDPASTAGLGEYWRDTALIRLDADLVLGVCSVDDKYLSGRLRIQVAGYADAFVSREERESSGERVVVHLKPDRTLVRVRVLFEDGTPFVGSLALHDAGIGSASTNEDTDEQGWIRPIPWSGSDLTVFSLGFAPPAGRADRVETGVGQLIVWQGRYLLGRISRDQVTDGEAVLVLDVSPVRGTLTVSGIPVDAPVPIALDLDGVRHRPTALVAGVATFEGLPVGTYCVGPPRWVDALGRRSKEYLLRAPKECCVQVESDGVTELDWESRWRLEAPLVGHVQCAPGMVSELYLRPWYVTRRGGAANSDLRIHLDATGHYRIPVGAPRPEVLLVCTSNSSSWVQVLEAIEPGSGAHVALGSMTLQWEGERLNENVEMRYAADGLQFDATFVDAQARGYRLDWDTRFPLTLSAASTDVHRVWFTTKVDGKRQRSFAVPVVIREGATTLVIVNE